MKKIFTRMLYRIYGEEFKCRRLFKIFGWRVYISQVKMRPKDRGDDTRRQLKYEAIKAANFKCQECGGKLPDKRYRVTVHSRLDQTHDITERYNPANTIVLCPSCNARYQILKKNKIWQTSTMRETYPSQMGLGVIPTQN